MGPVIFLIYFVLCPTGEIKVITEPTNTIKECNDKAADLREWFTTQGPYTTTYSCINSQITGKQT
jgi:hypothetical protein